MPPGQTILWMALVVLLCSTSALAADRKENDSTDLVHDKQPENTTRIALLDDPNESKDCGACECSTLSCEPVTLPPTPEPILPMMFQLTSSNSSCCDILEAMVWQIYDNWHDLNSTTIGLISEEKIANRCSYYDGVLKPCRHQCPLYDMLCYDTKQFVKEFKCLRGIPREKTEHVPFMLDPISIEAFKVCGKEANELLLTTIKDDIVKGVMCRAAHKLSECSANLLQGECGPIAKALYMNGYGIWKDTQIWHQKYVEKYFHFHVTTGFNLTDLDSDCLAYLNFRINNTLLGSSSSQNTACGSLIAAVLVICMLPLEIATVLASNRAKASLWITAVLMLCLATGLVLSDDPASPTCKCTKTHCPGPNDALCPTRADKITFELHGIPTMCCQPFFQPLDIDEIIESTVIPTVKPTYADGIVRIMLKEEALMQRCGLYNVSLKDCQEECPLYALICKDVQKFMEGLTCFNEKLARLTPQVKRDWSNLTIPANRSEIVCESAYNITQATALSNDSSLSTEDKCERRLKFYQCVETAFGDICPGIGAWLGLMNFFNNPDIVPLKMYYHVEDSIEPKCLLYADYIGKHTSPPGSSSPWNAAMSLGMVVAAIISGVVRHHILMNFR